MSLYHGKYRIPSTRLGDWDYSQPGWYYVTLCTHNRQCFLGTVADGQMLASAAGAIVAEEWLRTPLVRLNVALDAWVLMPNHLHGIVIIKELPGRVGDEMRDRTKAANKPGVARLVPGSLGAIVGQIKAVCKKRIRAVGMADFEWQPRFYDHIIRDAGALDKIRQYIVNNPAQWALDELNPPP